MSSRQEEKERRRREREEAERAAASSAARRKRLGLVGGGVLVAAILVVVLLAAFTGGDSNKPAGSANAELPPQRITNLTAAAKAAGCTVKQWPSEGRGHTTTAVKYKTNPPTSGAHDPTPAQDGIYNADNPPDVEQSVHSLEHGRVEFQYKPGTPAPRIAQLEALFNEKVKGSAGYHTLVFRNRTNMPYAVAATSWQHSLTCASWNGKVFDALRAFRRDNIDKGPEFIP